MSFLRCKINLNFHSLLRMKNIGFISYLHMGELMSELNMGENKRLKLKKG